MPVFTHNRPKPVVSAPPVLEVTPLHLGESWTPSLSLRWWRLPVGLVPLAEASVPLPVVRRSVPLR